MSETIHSHRINVFIGVEVFILPMALQELHAFVPPGTPYMAHTGTATRDLYKEVIETVEMTDCVKICIYPDHCNIFYEYEVKTLHMTKIRLIRAFTS